MAPLAEAPSLPLLAPDFPVAAAALLLPALVLSLSLKNLNFSNIELFLLFATSDDEALCAVAWLTRAFVWFPPGDWIVPVEFVPELPPGVLPRRREELLPGVAMRERLVFGETLSRALLDLRPVCAVRVLGSLVRRLTFVVPLPGIRAVPVDFSLPPLLEPGFVNGDGSLVSISE